MKGITILLETSPPHRGGLYKKPFIFNLINELTMKLTLVKSHFWKWFQKHAAAYASIFNRNEKEIVYLLDELNMHLRAYCKHLEGGIGINKKMGTMDLIISAHGRAAYFPKVDKLVACAPALWHWQVIALEPRQPLDNMLDICYPDVQLDPHRLWFEPLDEFSQTADIVVYSECCGMSDEGRFEAAVRAVLYNLLGERSYGLDLGELVIANLSAAPRKENLQRLEELPFYISKCISGHLEVGAGGELRKK
jgi:hypothetical protein